MPTPPPDSKKITDLDAAASVAVTSLLPVVTDPGGSPATERATGQQVADMVETAKAASPRPPTSVPRVNTRIVGIATNGDTLANCDILDPGNGTGLAAAIAASNADPKTIVIRPGVIDLTAVGAPTLPLVIEGFYDIEGAELPNNSAAYIEAFVGTESPIETQILVGDSRAVFEALLAPPALGLACIRRLVFRLQDQAGPGTGTVLVQSLGDIEDCRAHLPATPTVDEPLDRVFYAYGAIRRCLVYIPDTLLRPLIGFSAVGVEGCTTFGEPIGTGIYVSSGLGGSCSATGNNIYADVGISVGGSGFVANNSIYGNASGTGIEVSTGEICIVVANNRVDGNASTGIGLTFGTGTAVVGNTISDTVTVGVRVGGACSSTMIGANVNLAGTPVDDNGSGTTILGAAPTPTVPRPAMVVVGNAAAGDTSTTCNFLDPGDGTGIAAALATLTAEHNILWLRPGEYDRSAQVPLVAPFGLTQVVIMAEPGTVTIYQGDERRFFDMTTVPVNVRIEGINFIVNPIDVAAVGASVIGTNASPGGGQLRLKDVNISLPFTPAATETMEGVLRAATQYLERVSITGSYNNENVGGPRLVGVQGAGTVEMRGCTVQGVDQPVYAGGGYLLMEDSTITGSSGTTAAVGVVQAGSCTIRRSLIQTGTIPLLTVSLYNMLCEDTTFGSAPVGFSSPRSGGGLFRNVRFRFLTDAAVDFTGGGGWINPARFYDCEWTGCFIRARGVEESGGTTQGCRLYLPAIGLNIQPGVHQESAAGEFRGSAAGFLVNALVRLKAIPSGTETALGNWNIYQPDGGWFLGADNERWKFGVGQQSDQQVVDNYGTGLQSFSTYQGRLLHRLFLLTLGYDGTVATLYVNGQAVQTLTPTSGYEVANIANKLMLGRNTNAGVPTVASSIELVGFTYGVGAASSAASITTYYRRVLREKRLVDGYRVDLLYGMEETNPLKQFKGTTTPLTVVGGSYTPEAMDPLFA